MLLLSEIFCDHAVLQRGREIRVFGVSDAAVSVTLAGETVEASPENGFFVARFPAREAGGPFTLTASTEKDSVTVSDVMIGDVFVISGQSNAELTVAETEDADTVFLSRDDVRYFQMPTLNQDRYHHLAPLDTPFSDRWTSLTTGQARLWSAIGLFTGLHFADKEKVTVGVIAAFRGATAIQSFLPFETCAKYPYDPAQLHIDHRVFAWNVPSLFYRTMIRPLFPLSFRAAVWYQGESNTSLFECEFYKPMLKDMIALWRDKFENERLPFVIVQINRYPRYDVWEGWARIMLAQAEAVKETENTELVTIDDLGQYEKIHPTNKRQVAQRVCAALEKLTNK